MDELGNFLSNVPVVNSLFGLQNNATQAAQASAAQNLAAAQGAYSGLTPPTYNPVNYEGPQEANAVQPQTTQAAQASPSAFNNIETNPSYTQSQQAQLAALSNLAANGGANAATTAELNQIEAQNNQNAKGGEQAILQQANQRGEGGSGASLLAQLSNSQNATNNAANQSQQVAGQEANNAINAGQSAANIGSNLENTQFGQQAQVAASNNAINEFNAQNAQQAGEFNAGQNNQVGEYNTNLQQGVNNATANAYNQGQTMNNYTLPQATYAGQLQKAGGLAGADTTGLNYYNNQANMASQQAGNVSGSLIGGAATLGSGYYRGAGANSNEEPDESGAYGAWGGKVPGVPAVPGNSTLNDFVPVHTSPGEVVVPRSLSIGGTKSQIGNFVKNAPPISSSPPSMGVPRAPGIMNPNQNKEAMLSALKHIRNRAA